MKDWKQILYNVYTPDIGSIWVAPNGIWKNSFASNKPETEFHPSVVGKLSNCRTSCQIVPGTSKDYRKGACVFKVKLNTVDCMSSNESGLIGSTFNVEFRLI